jgi:fermentation-respiration switch protein FrsA (DUF1100 family)
MELKLAKLGYEFTEPYIPEAFKRLLRRLDLGTSVRRWEEGNPERMRAHVQRLLEKPILVLSGRDDEVVPWEASEHVVRKLEENLGGALTVKVYDGAGHEFTQAMKEDFRRWLVDLLNTREEN